MNFKHFLLVVFASGLIFSCAREETEFSKSAYLSGTITVDEHLDNSGDHSGIRLLTAIRHNSDTTDTLFFAITDSTGQFNGTARFENDGLYTVTVSRNNNTFGRLNVIFAEEDTITINGQLPDIHSTADIRSRENDILAVLERVERNFARVASFMNAGAVSRDSIPIEIMKWSDIYWELVEEYPGTHAALMAGENAVSVLRGWNDSLMVKRNDQLLERYGRVSADTRSVLVDYYAETGGLEEALGYLDRLQQLSPTQSDRIGLDIDRIELLYDSSRTTEANRHLDRFKEEYAENPAAMEWAENIRYDLEFLAPGSRFPELRFVLVNGDSLRTTDLEGKPFLMELTRLDNLLYQQQYDRTVAIYQIYKNFDLEIITVPIGASDVMLNAFFEERRQLWHIVKPNSFDATELTEKLNLNRLPTRFLVNSDGTIIRKYVGNEYDDVVRGLQQITTINND